MPTYKGHSNEKAHKSLGEVMDTMNDIHDLYKNGYLTARQHLALSDMVRIFHKDGADLKIDIRMLTKGGKLRKRASVKVVLGVEGGNQ